MSVLIKGIEKPQNCESCQFKDFGGCIFRAQKEDCPLVEVPPHGRLIDADTLESLIYERLSDIDYKADVVDILRIVQDMPTIIEAEYNCITDEVAQKITEEANKAYSNCQEWICDECEYRHWRDREIEGKEI